MLEMIPIEDRDLLEVIKAASAKAGVSAEAYIRQAVEGKLEDEHFGPLVEGRIVGDTGQRYTSTQIRADLGLDD